MNFKLIIILLCLVYKNVECDIFSSTSHLTNLMYLERHLINSMNGYIENLEEGLIEIKTYINDFMNSAGQPQLQGTFSDNLIANPLQAFHLIKRFAVQLKKINEKMDNVNWTQIKSYVEEYEHILPTNEDLNGAALSLIRLQDTYNLNYSDLIKGKILDIESNIEMNARDCLFFAKQSFNHGYYGHSLEWFDQALKKANQEGNTTASVDEIIPFYNVALKIHNDLSSEYWEDQKKNYNTSTPLPAKLRYFEGDNDDYRKHQVLCRDDYKAKKPEEEKHLKCYLSDQQNPYLILQPVKIEVFHTKPYIVIFHDLLTDKESDMIKSLAAPKLKRAKVQTDTSKEDEVSSTRTSQTAWFSPDDHPWVDKINQRITDVTGLSADMQASHSELMQIANYGMGGQYTPHYDYLIVDRPENERHLVPNRESAAGDRTCTLMFYLSDVQKGGSTVFPRLNVQLKPKKNSAAFWYNLYKNGEGIIETIHAACPVLMGEKWVSNHWLRQNGQTFRRKCSLDPNE